MTLHTLPYDLLLNVAQYLELRDIHAVQLTCKALYDFATTRPVFRNLAYELLRRCRALPLTGFQRLSDLSTEQLIRCVNKATQFEHSWRVRTPRPISSSPFTNGTSRPHASADGSSSNGVAPAGPTWYKIVTAPPNEEVDWLSPITSSYTLCATKSGKVVCWDVQTDECLAEWNPGEKWELWKCRVEFEERTVFFTMAKVLAATYDDDRVMEFVLMRLYFPETHVGSEANGHKPPAPPVFSHAAMFKTAGIVMNVFLLDPPARLLSAFVWVASSNTIGLYALIDWNKPEYVFIDTGIPCLLSSNWSCILHEQQIVVHSEEDDAAFQHFYPLDLLRKHTRPLANKHAIPSISGRVLPARTVMKQFIYPRVVAQPADEDDDGDEVDDDEVDTYTPEPDTPHHAAIALSAPSAQSPVDTPQYAALAALALSVPPAQSQVETPHYAALAALALSAPSAQSQVDTPHYAALAAIALSSAQSQVPSNGVSNGTNGTTITNGTAVANSATITNNTAITNGNTRPLENPFPFPQWYPESAHFVRQWWPTLPHVPRLSCTVVLLAAHDQDTHNTRFVLAQHYFRVPLSRHEWTGDVTTGESSNGNDGDNGVNHPEEEEDRMMRLWYVSVPFEVVCVMDRQDEDEDAMTGDRPRPLVAVDFGHAVWIEYVDPDGDHEADQDPLRPEMDEKRLRFVTFPTVGEMREGDGASGVGMEGVVRTLEVPEELDLHCVETINIDQSQGAVILSVKEGKIFILCYE